MIDLGEHAVFILWAYLGVFGAVTAVIALRLWSARRVEKRLAALEAALPARQDRA